jgi:hypothetical protein
MSSHIIVSVFIYSSTHSLVSQPSVFTEKNYVLEYGRDRNTS